VDENYIYEGTIQPVSGDPFWIGHLKKYAIESNGEKGAEQWDAGAVLAAKLASSRDIKTCLNGSTLTDFSTTNVAGYLGVSTTAQESLIVGFFRGEAPIIWRAGNWATFPFQTDNCRQTINLL